MTVYTSLLWTFGKVEITLLLCASANLLNSDASLCNTDCPHYLDTFECCPDEKGLVCRSNSFLSSLPVQSDIEYRMLKRCPPSFHNKSVIVLCQRGTTADITEVGSLLPVTSRITSTTFYNRFCALCNAQTHFYQWSLNITCTSYVALQGLKSEQEVLHAATTSSTCTVVTYPPPEVTAQTCRVQSKLDPCDEDFTLLSKFDRFLDEPCKSGNIFGSDGLLSEADIFGKDKSVFYHGTGGLTFGGDHGKAPLSVILRFNDQAVTETDESIGHRLCSSTGWYDPIKNTCRKLFCTDGKRLTKDKCDSVINEGRGLAYQTKLVLSPSSDQNVFTDNSNCSLKKAFEEYFTRLTSKLHTNAFNITMAIFSRVWNPNQREGGNITALSKCLEKVVLVLKFIVTENVKRDRYEKIALSLLSNKWILLCGGRNITFHSELANDDVMEPAEVEESKENRFFHRDKLTSTFGSVANEYILYELSQPRFFDISMFLLCPFVSLSSDDITVSSSGSEATISLTGSDVNIERSDVEFSNDGRIRVCKAILKEKYETLKARKALNDTLNVQVEIQNFLSLTCVCLSLIALVLTFVTYLMFPTLLTLPAKNNMCLIFNLFWAQALTQFGVARTEIAAVCRVIGILIHYFWLSAIFSMNICSYHMFRVFNSERVANTPQNKVWKRLLKYILYSQVTPLVIVTATIVTMHVKSDGSQIGYGDVVCYLSSAKLVGFAFALPLGVIMLLNVTFFILAVKSIAKISCLQRRVMAKGRRNLHVYMRLSSLTGLFWTVGLIAEGLDIQALRYVSIVLNGSQGVFIFVSCILNSRVRRICRNGCGIKCCSSGTNMPSTQMTSKPGTSSLKKT